MPIPKLQIPWRLLAQVALVTGFVLNAVTLKDSGLGITLAIVSLVVTFVSHDMRGARRQHLAD